MIAIIGKYGSGKTTFLKKIESYGFSVLYTDDFFKKCYEKNEECYCIIKESLGQEFVDDKSVLKNKLREFIIENKNNINIIEKLVYPVLEDHLKNNKYDFVEIPNLFTQNANFVKYFEQIFNIEISEEQRLKNIEKKYVDKKTSKLNNKLNNGKKGKKVVNIMWEDTHKKDFFIDFLKSLKLL